MNLLEEESLFRTIVEQLAQEDSSTNRGKMMSSPGIKYRNKVIAFYYDRAMVFKLGRNFKPEALGVLHYEPLAPFKTKPPMLDWFVVSFADGPRWEALARQALNQMREQLG